MRDELIRMKGCNEVESVEHLMAVCLTIIT
jgi:hypothetical protein